MKDAMVFKRRSSATALQRVRQALWPRSGYARVFRYHSTRIARIRATPHAIAAGVAAGVLSSCTPFLGLHILLAIVIAYLIAGNILAAVLGTALGNPLTLPFIWAASYEVGNDILGLSGQHAQHGGNLDLAALVERLEIAQLWDTVLKPMTIGGLLIGFCLAVPTYGAVRFGVGRFQAGRARRMAGRRHNGGAAP